MHCYHCGGKLLRINIKQKGDYCRRLYRCADCDKRISTIEQWLKPGPPAGTIKTGPVYHGEQNPASVFLAADIIRVRQLAKSGMMQKDIAIQFGMSSSYVSRIINRHAWKHL
jgi:NAD-dependent SIR2 family protein deacetylase